MGVQHSMGCTHGWIDSVHANESITLHARMFLPLNVQKSLTNITGIESVLFIQLD